jgi:hypothetical protein
MRQRSIKAVSTLPALLTAQSSAAPITPNASFIRPLEEGTASAVDQVDLDHDASRGH